jgi:hypothetical protein
LATLATLINLGESLPNTQRPQSTNQDWEGVPWGNITRDLQTKGLEVSGIDENLLVIRPGGQLLELLGIELKVQNLSAHVSFLGCEL